MFTKKILLLKLKADQAGGGETKTINKNDQKQIWYPLFEGNIKSPGKLAIFSTWTTPTFAFSM